MSFRNLTQLEPSRRGGMLYPIELWLRFKFRCIKRFGAFKREGMYREPPLPVNGKKPENSCLLQGIQLRFAEFIEIALSAVGRVECEIPFRLGKRLVFPAVAID